MKSIMTRYNKWITCGIVGLLTAAGVIACVVFFGGQTHADPVAAITQAAARTFKTKEFFFTAGIDDFLCSGRAMIDTEKKHIQMEYLVDGNGASVAYTPSGAFYTITDNGQTSRSWQEERPWVNVLFSIALEFASSEVPLENLQKLLYEDSMWQELMGELDEQTDAVWKYVRSEWSRLRKRLYRDRKLQKALGFVRYYSSDGEIYSFSPEIVKIASYLLETGLDSAKGSEYYDVLEQIVSAVSVGIQTIQEEPLINFQVQVDRSGYLTGVRLETKEHQAFVRFKLSVL